MGIGLKPSDMISQVEMCSMFWMQKKIQQEMTVAMVKYNYYEVQFRIIVCFDLLYSKSTTELHF